MFGHKRSSLSYNSQNLLLECRHYSLPIILNLSILYISFINLNNVFETFIFNDAMKKTWYERISAKNTAQIKFIYNYNIQRFAIQFLAFTRIDLQDTTRSGRCAVHV